MDGGRTCTCTEITLHNEKKNVYISNVGIKDKNKEASTCM